MVFLLLTDTFWIHNHSWPMWQLVPNVEHVRENTFKVDGDPQIEPSLVTVIWWIFQTNRELQDISWLCQQCFLLGFHLNQPTLPAATVFTAISAILAYFLKEYCPSTMVLRVLSCYWNNTPWDRNNCVYVSVTQFRNSSGLLSRLTIVQECGMSLLGCWRGSNFCLTSEPCPLQRVLVVCMNINFLGMP